MCGKEYRSIGNMHLKNIHSMTGDDYRVRYGLPWGAGLDSGLTREKRAQAAKLRMENDPQFMEKLLSFQKSVVRRGPRRPQMPYHAEHTKKAALSAHGLTKTYTSQDAEKVLTALEAETPRFMVGEAGYPKHSWWYAYLRDNLEFSRRVDEAWDRAPFSFAAKHGRLGPRFVSELRKLFDAGYPDYKAGAALGVTAMTCNKHTKVWRQTHPDSE